MIFGESRAQFWHLSECVCQYSIIIVFRYYGGQDEHQQEAVLRHEVEGRSGEVGFSCKHFSGLGIHGFLLSDIP